MDHKELKRALIDKGMSAKDLADKLGMNYSSVYHWTGGYREIPKEHYPAIIEILGMNTGKQTFESSNEEEGPVDKIPENLKILREKHKLTQDELAAKLGLTRQQDWPWVYGRRPALASCGVTLILLVLWSTYELTLNQGRFYALCTTRSP